MAQDSEAAAETANPDVYIHPCCNCPETDVLSIQCDRCDEWWHKKCLVLPKYGWTEEKIEMAIQMAFACPVCDDLITNGGKSTIEESFSGMQNPPLRIKVKKEKDDLFPTMPPEDLDDGSDDSISSDDEESESFEEYNPKLDMSDRDSEDASSSDEDDSSNSQELKKEVNGLRDSDDPHFKPKRRARRKPTRKKKPQKRKPKKKQPEKNSKKSKPKLQPLRYPKKILPIKVITQKNEEILIDPQTVASGNFEKDVWIFTRSSVNPLQLLEPINESSKTWVAQNNYGSILIQPQEEVTILKESSTILKVLEQKLPEAETSNANFEIVLFLVCLLIEIDAEKTLRIITELVLPWLHLDNRQTLWCMLHQAYEIPLRIERGYQRDEGAPEMETVPAPRIPKNKRKFSSNKPSTRPVKKRKIEHDDSDVSYKCVQWVDAKRKWRGRFKHAGKEYFCGHFDTSIDAARAVNLKCADISIPPKNHLPDPSPMDIERIEAVQKASRSPKKSKYKCIAWDPVKRKWRAQFSRNGTNVHCGYYVAQIDAARAVNIKCLELGIPPRNNLESLTFRSSVTSHPLERSGVIITSNSEKKKKKKKKKKDKDNVDSVTYTESTMPMSAAETSSYDGKVSSNYSTGTTSELPMSLGGASQLMSSSPPSSSNVLSPMPRRSPQAMTKSASVTAQSENLAVNFDGGLTASLPAPGRLHVGRLPFTDINDARLKQVKNRAGTPLPDHQKKKREKQRSTMLVMEKWSINDVGTWVASLGDAYLKYKQLFISSGVHGRLLLKMEQVDFTDMGIQNNFHIKKIQMELESLKKAARNSKLKRQKKKMAKNLKTPSKKKKNDSSQRHSSSKMHKEVLTKSAYRESNCSSSSARRQLKIHKHMGIYE